MTTRRKRILAAVLGVLLVFGVVATVAGLWERLYFQSQGLDVGEPSSSWPVKEVQDASDLTRIAAVGDIGTGHAPEYAVVAAMDAQHQSRRYDAIVMLGDLVYPDGEARLVDEVVLRPYAPLLRDDVDLIPVLGNHDHISGQGDEIMKELGRTSAWYAEVVGPALVVVLDSNQVEDPAQTSWLRSTLRDSTSTWTIVAMHHPPYSAGWHGSSIDVREAWSGLFMQYGVDLVLAGHDHDYQRSKVIDGIVYVVSGGGAKTRPTGHDDDFTAFSASTLNYLDLQITSDSIYGQAIGTDKAAFDEFTLRNGS